MRQLDVIIKRPQLSRSTQESVRCICPWHFSEHKICTEIAGACEHDQGKQMSTRLAVCVLWSISVCLAFRCQCKRFIHAHTSRWHKACSHCSPQRGFGWILGSLEQILKLVAYKGGTCFLIAITKYFRDGLLDGTRGGNWGRAVGGYMLDGCTTRGGIEVGGL